MTGVSIRWADDHLRHYAELLEQVHRENPVILPRIVNQVGDKARTAVVRSLAAQTGLTQKVIRRAIGRPARAHPAKLTYDMTTHGGFIRLKYLNPGAEKRSGVIAKPFGQPKLFAGAFTKGGQWPRRIAVPTFKGHVMQRLDKAGRRLTQVRSQVRIPHEMTVGATKAAFERTAAPLLRERVEAMLIRRFGR